MPRSPLPLSAALVLLLAGLPAARAGVLEPIVVQSGVLDRHDQVLPDGSFADVYPIDVQVGDRVMIELQSKKFDPYLAVKLPSGAVLENDDLAGSKKQSQLDIFAEEAGTWLVYATSYTPNKRGKYQIRISVDTSGRGSSPRGAGEVTTPISSGEAVQGTLGAGDRTLPAGEWADVYTIDVQAGQQLTVDMTSDVVDTYVVARSPSGTADGNDDFEGSNRHSRYQAVVEESGTWEVFATTYGANDGGPYRLQVDVGVPSASSAASSVGDAERWSGALDSSDSTISSGEYADIISVEGRAGERWVVDLRSSEFDPFLIVRSPEGNQEQNDDFEGARDRSLLDMTLTESGTYMLVPTTYRPGEVGRYDLTLRRITDGADGGVVAGSQPRTGRLEAGDEQLSGGEWYDTYEFVGIPGQPLRARLTGDFDTYLGLVGPNGFRMENDDAPDGAQGSVVEAVLPEAGTYTAVVTSYAAGQGGRYSLDLGLDAGIVQGEADGQRDVSVLVSGRPVPGTLAEGDMTLDSGEYQDRYVIDVEAGQHISVAVRSTAFDPYVGLVLPDGSVVENDDFEGDRNLARVDLEAQVSGRYRVIATSYRAGETGSYTLSAELGAASAPTGPVASSTGGRIYGLFVGISDYPEGGPTDLNFTADDARNLYAGMQRVGMQPEDGRLLVDSEATRAATLTAIRELGSQMGPSDLLVLFYSGHGGRIASVGEQQADPDGFDETLALYDGQVRDDELAEALSDVRQGIVLLVLDSCFSGGFSKDVISRPGRMGLFSSNEDVTSSVASKFRAGGYLARFMVDAVGDRLADEDHNGQLTALELSQYLYERYRDDVKSSPGDTKGGGAYDGIVMSSRNLGYQQIVVDRGGVGAYQVLFAW